MKMWMSQSFKSIVTFLVCLLCAIGYSLLTPSALKLFNKPAYSYEFTEGQLSFAELPASSFFETDIFIEFELLRLGEWVRVFETSPDSTGIRFALDSQGIGRLMVHQNRDFLYHDLKAPLEIGKRYRFHFYVASRGSEVSFIDFKEKIFRIPLDRVPNFDFIKVSESSQEYIKILDFKVKLNLYDFSKFQDKKFSDIQKVLLVLGVSSAFFFLWGLFGVSFFDFHIKSLRKGGRDF